VKLFVNSRAVADTRKVLLDGVAAGGGGGGGAAQLQDDKADRNADSSRFGASTLASESTSKSSVEWQSSTVTKDSETEYPFSSSSRRSSARWESYTLFRKYDEDMVYFHRVGAQKLTETGRKTVYLFILKELFVFLEKSANRLDLFIDQSSTAKHSQGVSLPLIALD
jgi:hypothetical protein